MYKSQLNQDKWVQSILGDKHDGFFVELGASDGVELSNTFFFEKTLGWNGICIEPNPNFHTELRKNRNCHICTSCASSSDDSIVEFAVCGHASGAVSTAGPFTVSNTHIKVPTKTLGTIFKAYSAPSVIDYLSLDVEGHELEVLAGFPFSEYVVQCITVEHNEPHTGPTMRTAIREILETRGYNFIKGNDDVHNWRHGPIDDFYVHCSVSLP